MKGKKKKLKNALYEIKGENISRKNKFCPKCGAGIFMANHKDRMACGKCGYAEWKPK
ncbi:MAG: 30S ribosomal protein S27ae [archaeon]